MVMFAFAQFTPLPSPRLDFRGVCALHYNGKRESRPVSASLGSDIERALCATYRESEISRVLDSFRAVREGQTLERGAGTARHQLAHSFVKFQSEARPFHDPSEYPWASYLSTHWEEIAEELSVVTSQPNVLATGNRIWAPPVVEAAKAYGKEWRTLVLKDREWDSKNVELFPRTVEIIKKSGVPVVEAFFARQAPNSGISRHTDGTNFIHTAHLSLDAPDGLSFIEVGEDRKYWKNGEVLIFDTSFFHWTQNDSPSDSRYVLLLRFWAPDLSQTERDALHFLFSAIQDPDRVLGNSLGQDGHEASDSSSDLLSLPHRGDRLRSLQNKKKSSSGRGFGKK